MMYNKALLLVGISWMAILAYGSAPAEGGKMVEITVTEEKIGKLKPALHGGNLAPPLHNEEIGMSIRDTYKELRPAFARLHDAPLENPAMRLVDVNLIFANFHADPDDPRNYYFTQTDDYITNCINLGVPIFYRLGASIEHSFRKYFVNPPEDTAKWIKIATNIIRHYTEGWGNGYNYDIQYWEIWNEPDIPGGKMWTGSLAEFNKFYVETAKALKARFPHLKIGGPAHTAINEEFLRYCAEHKAPLDFYSYHNYTRDPFGTITQSPAKARELLDSLGYTQTEIHLNEWHYCGLRDGLGNIAEMDNKLKCAEVGAASTLILTLWHDTPLDAAAYYTLTRTGWGVYTRNTNVPTPTYYALKAFGKMLDFPVRLKAVSDKREVGVLAGCAEDGSRALLISNFKTGDIVLKINGMNSVKNVLFVDDERKLEPGEFDFSGNTLKIRTGSDSSVCFVEYQ